MRLSLSVIMVGLASVVTVLVTACSDSSTGSALNAPGLLGAVRLEPQAITMALHQTMPLRMTAFDIRGDTIAHPDSVWYTTTDASAVTVDPTGVVTAVGVTQALNPVAIAVMTRVGNNTLTDTVTVAVTPTEIPVTGLHLMSLLTGGRTSIYTIDLVMATFMNGTTPVFGNLNVRYDGGRRGALLLAFIDPIGGTILPFWPGPMTVTATATAYGTTYRDTMPYLNLYKSAVSASIWMSGDGPLQLLVDGVVHTQFFLATGGTVTFTNLLADSATLHFSGPASIPDETLAAHASNAVTFSVAGHYAWTITQGTHTITGAFDIGDPQ